MLLDNSIMKSFGAKLDWLTECLSFQDSLETIPARHVKSPVQSKYCSYYNANSRHPTDARIGF